MTESTRSTRSSHSADEHENYEEAPNAGDVIIVTDFIVGKKLYVVSRKNVNRYVECFDAIGRALFVHVNFINTNISCYRTTSKRL